LTPGGLTLDRDRFQQRLKLESENFCFQVLFSSFAEQTKLRRYLRDSKHSKLPFVAEEWEDTQLANGGVTTAGVAVRGARQEQTAHQMAKTSVGQAKLKARAYTRSLFSST